MENLMIALSFLMFFFVNPAKPPKPLSRSEVFIRQQEKVIQSHAKILMAAGRMPTDFGLDMLVLGTYGWHSGKDTYSPGAHPTLELLQEGSIEGTGSFGAYSFYEPAFQQAKRSWWINGVMKQGSDLLIAVNRNAEFIQLCRSESWGSDGSHEKDCDPPMNSAVGYHVGPMYQGPEDAIVVEVIDHRTLRLDKKAPSEVLQYGLSILPPDYVDMCECITSSH